jgi:hypothetical protein
MSTRCVIVLIPTKFTVYWPVAREILSAEGLERVSAAVEEEAKVRRAVSEHLQADGVEYVDPVEAMQAAAQRDALYLSNADGHPNIRGNEVLADSIVRKSIPALSCRDMQERVN